MAPEFSKDDLNLLLRAAQSAGLDPGKLKAANPWSFAGSTATALQVAVSELDPVAAERFQNEAGVTLSLGAQAALDGLQPWTPDLERELASKAPATYQRLEQEQIEAAADAAFGAFRARRAEAEQVAEQYGWNVDALVAAGHHLAARAASEHHDQLKQQEQRAHLESLAWLSNAVRT